MAKAKQRAYNRAKRSGLETDWDRFKVLKHDIQRECRDAFNNYMKSIITEDGANVNKKILDLHKINEN